MKISVYIATSLDGYIARRDGSLDWLPGADGAQAASDDYGYQDFVASVDAFVLGRHTFETVLSFGAWPYEDKSVFVLSHSLKSLPQEVPKSVTLTSGSASEICHDLESAGFQHVYLDGGTTIQAFLRAGLVDDLIITIIPVLIGDGISLFGRLTKDIKLELVQCRSFDSGFVQTHYKIVK